MKVMGVVFSNIHDKNITELTANRTLASVPFGGRFRLIDFVLSNMVNSGINKVGVITKFNYQSLMDHVGSGKYWDLSRKNGGLMVLPPFGVESSQTLYSSRFEAIQNIEQFIKRSDEDYVVMSDCDNVCNFDFTEAVQYHINKCADITIVYRKKDIDTSVKKVRTAIEMDKDGRVTKVVNSDKFYGTKNIYTNMLVINRQFLLNIIENSLELGFKSFSRDVLVKGVQEFRMYAYEQTGYFASIDSLANYYKHSMELLDKGKRDALFYNNGANIYTKVRDSAPCKICADAQISNSMIADGCIIEGDVTNSILFRGVRVAKGAKISNSIVFQDSAVGENTVLNCVIADKQVKILDGRHLSGHPTHPYFIAKNCVI